MREETHVLPRWRRRTLLAVLAFEAVGSFIGGPLLVAAPGGRLLEMPVEMLQGAFPDFLVPGLLLTFLGVLNAIAFFVLLRRQLSSWLWSGLALGGFFIWFVVELAIVGAGSWLQAIWGLPVLLGLYAAWPLAEERFGRGRHAGTSGSATA